MAASLLRRDENTVLIFAGRYLSENVNNATFISLRVVGLTSHALFFIQLQMFWPKNINIKDFLNGTHNCTFQFKKIDDILILRIINDLPNKSSTGFDYISMRIIKAIKT